MDPMRNPEEHGYSEPHSEPQGEAHEALEGGWKKAQEGFRSMKEQAGESLESFQQRLSETAHRTLLQQKDRSVGGLKRLSSAIHDAAAKLDEEGDHTLAEYTDLLGNQVDKAADYLRRRDPSSVLHDLENVARRQAGLIIGGMFVTGLIVARFIKSAQRRETAETALAPQAVSPSSMPPAPAEPLSAPTPPSSSTPTSSRFGNQDFGEP